MLRVGLTGGLGSGKSSVARVWTEAGVPVIEADALGRTLMQPDQAVYAAIVEAFGPSIVRPDHELDRSALARIAFSEGRIDELNRIVHPAVIAAQEDALLQAEGAGHALAVVESALIFEASGEEASGEAGDGASSQIPRTPGTAPGWRDRFNRLVLVAAPEHLKIERFVARVAPSDASPQQLEALRADAHRRLGAQWPDDWKRSRCDYVIENTRTLVLLRREALHVLGLLRRDAAPEG